MVVVIRPFIFGEHMTIPVSDRLSQLYVGNGTNKRFDFTFRVFQQEDETGISIRKKGAVEFETLDPSTYVVQINQDDMGGYITFNSAPAAGTYFYIAGTTNLDQLLDITNYDNFYPDAIERALDKLTALLQERSTEIDQEKQSRILADLKYDALAMEREDNLENRLTSYINAMIGITNPAIFDGISDRMIITKDGRTQREFNETLPFWTDEFVKFMQETYLREEQILDSTDLNLQTAKNELDTKINNETSRALEAESLLDAAIAATAGGYFKSYPTLAQANADIANIPLNVSVKILSADDGGDYYKATVNATSLTKSPYDPLVQAKAYADSQDANFVTQNTAPNLFEFLDSNSKVIAWIDGAGMFHSTNTDLNAITVAQLVSKTDANAANIATLSTHTASNESTNLHEFQDSAGNVVAYIDANGTLNAFLKNLDITAQDTTQDTTTEVTDLTYFAMNIGKGILKVDVIGILPKTPTDSIKNKVVFYINDIQVLKTYAVMSLQGQSSVYANKKNYALDLLNINGDPIVVKFGDMVEADSIHLKGFEKDPTHTREQACYRVWQDMIRSLDYPYCKVNNIPFSTPTGASKEMIADAKYYPYGFPIELQNGGSSLGVYTLRTKKLRENYALDKADVKQVYLDTIISSTTLKSGFDAARWEVRNPKMSGYSEGDAIPSKYTATVGASIAHLFEFTADIAGKYSTHSDYIVLPHWIAWYVIAELSFDWDKNSNNYNIITWDGVHWSMIPYDMDSAVGSLVVTPPDAFVLNSSSDIWGTFRTTFINEIKAQYKKWRASGVISTMSVMQHFIDIASVVPRELYKTDRSIWVYSNLAVIPSIEQQWQFIQKRIAFLDAQWL